LISIFQDSHLPRDPHSYPTRRSSDLSTSASIRSISSRAEGAATSSPAPECRTRKSRSFCRSISEQGIATAPTFRQKDLDFRVRQDRKSTRLNSSHVASSYAFLCLKRK